MAFLLGISVMYWVCVLYLVLLTAFAGPLVAIFVSALVWAAVCARAYWKQHK
jgi:hypothetical protein